MCEKYYSNYKNKRVQVNQYIDAKGEIIDRRNKEVMDNLNSNELNFLFDLCLKSKTWIKWFPLDFRPIDNKLDLIRVCGHYLYSNHEFNSILNPQRFEPIIKSSLKKKFTELSQIV